jgi:hypothetical protein
VDLPQSFASHLRDLVESIGLSDNHVTRSLAALTIDVRAAVSSYLGLRLTVVLDGWPVTLTSFLIVDGVAPATSLRLVMSPLGFPLARENQLVFYAGTPGAFVDLAADYAYLHRRSEPHGPAVAIDIDLPPITLVSGFTGLAEYTTINRAIGLLIDRGLVVDQARATLHRDAAVSGLPLHLHAAQLLHG